MKIIKKCPVCGKNRSFSVFSVKAFPYITVPVKRRDKQEILSRYSVAALRSDLEPVACKGCSHIYLKKQPDEKIISTLYSKYYSYPSALQGKFVPQREKAFLEIFKRAIQKKLKKDHGLVLEIGCYDGYILWHLKRLGFSVEGCDPSDGADIGKKYGLEIRKQFFKAADYIGKGRKYDVVIFRHLLEHVPDPVVFLKTLKNMLNPYALVVFEVPNIEFCLRNKNTSVFSFQHLQYFSGASVRHLIERADYRLVELVNTGENLIAICAQGKAKKALLGKAAFNLSRSFAADLKNKIIHFKNMLKTMPDERLAMWGAGTFSRSVIATYGLKENRIKCIVDSDPNKWGMEYLEYPFAVESPEALKHQKQDGLMVCSMYTAQIMRQLRKMHYKGTIIQFHPKVAVTNNNMGRG